MDKIIFNTDNIVVSVPDYYTVQERAALLNSLYIGGINCLTLLNKSIAISFYYSYKNKPEIMYNHNIKYVAFVDLRQSHLSIFM